MVKVQQPELLRVSLNLKQNKNKKKTCQAFQVPGGGNPGGAAQHYPETEGVRKGLLKVFVFETNASSPTSSGMRIFEYFKVIM